MSAISQFTVWYQRLLGSVENALNGPMQDGLKQAIREEAQTKVYDAYSSTGERRGKIGAAENLQGEVIGHQLRITNVTQPQGSGARMTETSFVEQGAGNYRQPFPRPFMDEARDKYADGQAQIDLENALRSDGFTVI